MRGGWMLITGAGAGALAACAAGGDNVAVRPLASPLAAGRQPLNIRVAEGRAQFALGNVALALEAFRKGLREEPASVDALNGMAACYDRMGRFDLSRRYYEDALAIAPEDPRLYRNLALSLEMQGKADEAVSVRAEYALRLAAARESAAGTEPGVAAVAVQQALAVHASAISRAPAPDPRLAVAMETARPLDDRPLRADIEPVRTIEVARIDPVAATPPAARSVTIRLAPAAERMASGSPRLERLSPGEVALITASAPRWAALPAVRPTRLALARLPGRQVVTLLNAARVEGLASRTRASLAQRGWRGIVIGNAARTVTSTTLVYPAERRAEALRLAAQFGFSLRHRVIPGSRITILLARDAAGSRLLQERL